MFAKVLVAPAGSFEAACTAASLEAAGVTVTDEPGPDVDAVVLVTARGQGLARIDELFLDGRRRPLLLVTECPEQGADRRDPVRPTGVVDWTAPTGAVVDSLERLATGASWTCEAERQSDALLHRLTGRERDVARLLGEGATNEAIAAALGISYHTARTHVANILAKLGVSQRYAVMSIVRGGDLVAAGPHRSGP